MEIITKGEYAYRRLHDDILSGKIPGGSRLVVKDLVEEYQVSSMPIRNAITRLEELGFVHTSAHQGAWVSEMNLRNYFTFMLLRIEAEALAAMFAAMNHSDAFIQELEELYHAMESARDAKDYETYGRVNRKSHNLVCEVSNNPSLLEYINILMSRTQLAVSFFVCAQGQQRILSRTQGLDRGLSESRHPAQHGHHSLSALPLQPGADAHHPDG